MNNNGKNGINELISLINTSNQFFKTNYDLLVETLFNEFIKGREIKQILDLWDNPSKVIILSEVFRRHCDNLDFAFGDDFINNKLSSFMLSMDKVIDLKYLKDHIVYCDESMNVRKALIRTNVNNELKDRFFTLGGVIVPNEVNLDDVKILFPEHKYGEFKYDFISYGRSMPDCLSSDRLSKLLDYLIDNKIKIHFNVKNYIYYGLADIIDSFQISFDKPVVDALKSVFYDYLIKRFDETYQLLIDFEYPSVPHGKEKLFVERLVEVFEKSLQQDSNKRSQEYLIGSFLLKALKSKADHDLVLIQDNEAFVLENSMINDYIHTASIFLFNGVVFDEEKKIQFELAEIDKSYLETMHCSFKNSKENIGIQLSDCVAGFISRLLSYVVQIYKETGDDILTILKDNPIAIENLKKFGTLYSRSNDFYMYSICSIMSQTEKYAFDSLFNIIC